MHLPSQNISVVSNIIYPTTHFVTIGIDTYSHTCILHHNQAYNYLQDTTELLISSFSTPSAFPMLSLPINNLEGSQTKYLKTRNTSDKLIWVTCAQLPLGAKHRTARDSSGLFGIQAELQDHCDCCGWSSEQRVHSSSGGDYFHCVMSLDKELITHRHHTNTVQQSLSHSYSTYFG